MAIINSNLHDAENIASSANLLKIVTTKWRTGFTEILSRLLLPLRLSQFGMWQPNLPHLRCYRKFKVCFDPHQQWYFSNGGDWGVEVFLEKATGTAANEAPKLSQNSSEGIPLHNVGVHMYFSISNTLKKLSLGKTQLPVVKVSLHVVVF